MCFQWILVVRALFDVNSESVIQLWQSLAMLLHFCGLQLSSIYSYLFLPYLCDFERSCTDPFLLHFSLTAASPFNLYNVKPSNILRMLSLVIAYVIVLIQNESLSPRTKSYRCLFVWTIFCSQFLILIKRSNNREGKDK